MSALVAERGTAGVQVRRPRGPVGVAVRASRSVSNCVTVACTRPVWGTRLSPMLLQPEVNLGIGNCTFHRSYFFFLNNIPPG